MATTVLTYLDTYCERAGQAGVFAEPFNAVTNLFFIAVGVMVVRALVKVPVTRAQIADLWLLALFLFGIGVGSSLWHTVPRQATMLMDVIPITLFINLYIVAALRRLMVWPWARVVGFWLAYLAASIVAQKALPADLFNGTIMYIPTYGALLMISGMLWFKDKTIGYAFMLAVGVWSVALVFRTIDLEICSRFKLGTHFLWHTLNAWVLWHLMGVLIARVGEKPRRRTKGAARKVARRR